MPISSNERTDAGGTSACQYRPQVLEYGCASCMISTVLHDLNSDLNSAAQQNVARQNHQNSGVSAMKSVQVAIAFLVAGVFLYSASPADAQRYRSSSPTLSPWLDLSRTDNGILDSYHDFVRPRQRLRSTLDRHSRGMQQHSANIRALGRQMNVWERGSGVRPTGAASTFMNYSHYYPRASGRR